MLPASVWGYELTRAVCEGVCVCVLVMVGGFVCDKYQWLGQGEGLWYLPAIDTLRCCWDSPQSHPLLLSSCLPSLHPLPPLLLLLPSSRFPGRFSAVVFSHAGCVWTDAAVCPPPQLRLLLLPPNLPASDPPPFFALKSFFFLVPPTPPRPLLLPSRLSSLAAFDCTGLFGMQEAPEAWRV